jgi:outer membrane protein OmpA-like peptidoglycan-associated protein
LTAGKVLQLANVFYDTDSWRIKKESEPELDRLYKLLAENSGLVVEIGGYTDSTGTVEYNNILSEKRALSVLDYLAGRGISRSRLEAKGYGAASPIGDNITFEGRRLNRRTEVRIVRVDAK